MYRLAVLLCALAVVGLVGAAGFAGDCSVSKTEKAQYCEKCDKVIEKKDEVDKDGKHTAKDCGEGKQLAGGAVRQPSPARRDPPGGSQGADRCELRQAAVEL